MDRLFTLPLPNLLTLLHFQQLSSLSVKIGLENGLSPVHEPRLELPNLKRLRLQMGFTSNQQVDRPIFIICRNIKILNLQYTLEYDLGNPLNNPTTWMKFDIINMLQELEIQLEIDVVNNLEPPVEQGVMKRLLQRPEQQLVQRLEQHQQQLEQQLEQQIEHWLEQREQWGWWERREQWEWREWQEQKLEQQEQQKWREWKLEQWEQQKQQAAGAAGMEAEAAEEAGAVGVAGKAGTVGVRAGTVLGLVAEESLLNDILGIESSLCLKRAYQQVCLPVSRRAYQLV